jgi:hypothetical protein
MEILKQHRDGKGDWHRFPFHYTLLALTDMRGESVVTEIQYAAPKLERMLKRQPRNNKFDLRRRVIAERILARV